MLSGYAHSGDNAKLVKEVLMRRGVSVAMVIFGVWIVVTGIWQVFPPFNTGVEPVHLIPAFCFAVLMIIHVWLNWKPLLRYFKGLGWRWVLIGLGILGILWSAVGMPITLRMQ